MIGRQVQNLESLRFLKRPDTNSLNRLSRSHQFACETGKNPQRQLRRCSSISACSFLDDLHQELAILIENQIIDCIHARSRCLL